MEREIKFEFIINNEGTKCLSREYTLEDLMDSGDEYKILEDMETCNCSMNESTNHCEGDCLQFENSEVIGKRQFTGLKDKNNIDVYERDIVSDEDGLILIVTYLINHKLVVGVNESDGTIYYSFITGYLGQFRDRSGYITLDEVIEVIGNIDENPDLLQSKDS